MPRNIAIKKHLLLILFPFQKNTPIEFLICLKNFYHAWKMES